MRWDTSPSASPAYNWLSLNMGKKLGLRLRGVRTSRCIRPNPRVVLGQEPGEALGGVGRVSVCVPAGATDVTVYLRPLGRGPPVVSPLGTCGHGKRCESLVPRSFDKDYNPVRRTQNFHNFFRRRHRRWWGDSQAFSSRTYDNFKGVSGPPPNPSNSWYAGPVSPTRGSGLPSGEWRPDGCLEPAVDVLVDVPPVVDVQVDVRVRPDPLLLLPTPRLLPLQPTPVFPVPKTTPDTPPWGPSGPHPFFGDGSGRLYPSTHI